MNFSITQHFPTNLDTLWQVFGSEDYPQEKYKTLGAIDYKLIHLIRTEEHIDILLTRTIPVDDINSIPSIAKKFIKSEQQMQHHVRWQRVSSTELATTFDVIAVGLPIQITGTGTLTEDTLGQSTLVLHFDVTSNVPLIGNKLAQLFGERMQNTMPEDHAFSLAYIARHAPRQA